MSHRRAHLVFAATTERRYPSSQVGRGRRLWPGRRTGRGAREDWEEDRRTGRRRGGEGRTGRRTGLSLCQFRNCAVSPYADDALAWKRGAGGLERPPPHQLDQL